MSFTPFKLALASIFSRLNATLPEDNKDGFIVTSPADGAGIIRLAEDSQTDIDRKIALGVSQQKKDGALNQTQRIALVENIAESVRHHADCLAELITLEVGKTAKEALAEVSASADVLVKTCNDVRLPHLAGMRRCKTRDPVGMVGLITSFNFPLVVANWTIAPALLAGNGIIWKPSEKTPLTALAYKAVFDQAASDHSDLLHVLVGGRVVAETMVAHESVDMISATGSVGMGRGIKNLLAKKHNNSIKPILELGGNNGVIISQHLTREHLDWAILSLLNSFLGTTGQRCTNTRRLIVHQSIYDDVISGFEQHIKEFLASDAIQNPLSGVSNEFGYGPLIDEDAYHRFERAKLRVHEEGGEILFGNRVHETLYPQAFYVEPALALLPAQSPVMHEETFAPLLYIIPYTGDIHQAIHVLNAPDNAGLVNGIYTGSVREAEIFSCDNQAGHSVINSPKGTGTPAFGMGFGGNKASGEGEILNAADCLQPFVRHSRYYRTAFNTEISMDFA